MEQTKNGVIIFLGIAILFAGFFISGGLDNISDSIDQRNDEYYNDYDNDDDMFDESYELIVQDGIIYMWETTTGEVWKKPDTKDSEWEEVDSLYED